MDTRETGQYACGEEERVLVLTGGPLADLATESKKHLPCEDTRYGILRKMVADLLKDQGAEITIRDRDRALEELTSPSDNETPESTHQESSHHYGCYDINPFADRIFKLAVGIADGDPEKTAAVKQGIDRGFNDALEAFGGCLPAASHLTRNVVFQKLEQWNVELTCQG